MATGCFTTALHDARVTPGEKHDKWRSFFLWGLAGKAEIDVREFCSGDVYEVATGTNFGTWIVSGLTLGIYSPEKIYITCGDGTSKVTMDVDRKGRPLRVEVRERGSVWVGEPTQGMGPGAWNVALHDPSGSGEVAQ
jgi:Bor protein